MKKRDTPLKTFRQFIEIDDLQEGVLRTGAILVAANASRRAGDDAQRAFETGIRKLRQPIPDADIENQINQLRDIIGSLLTGMIHMQKQIGNHTSADVAGHLLTSKYLKNR